MTSTTFRDLGLLEPIEKAVLAQGYDSPTPIQAQAIPHLLNGRDLLGIAQTGTGKTAAFALPILDFLAGDPQPTRSKRPTALILTPTRELAAQIGESFERYGTHVKVPHAVIFGGVGQQPQVKALARGIDVLVATPGRLIDLIDQGHCDLSDVEVFVLDEADRMLDMGFLPSVKRILQRLPEEKQSLLFSATMPSDIAKLAHSILHDPIRVEVTPPATTVEKIDQKVLLVDKANKRHLLAELLKDTSIDRCLVFTRTKHGADRVVKHLRKVGIESAAIHGNKGQGARERALEQFRSGKLRALIATDIAARGIDVPDLGHVIQFDLPNIPETYVHRIGRTARAGKDGVAVAFCDTEEREYLFDIEKAIDREVPLGTGHPYEASAPLVRPAKRSKSSGGSRKPGSKKTKKKKRRPGRRRSGSGQPASSRS